MKAAVLYEVGKLVVEELDLDPPREGEVLVKLTASGVCRSDHARVTGKRPLPLPIVLGHEGAGVVEEVGKGVKALKAGDNVVLSWIAPCGACRYCLMGRPNLCTTAIANGAKGVMPDGTRRLRRGDSYIHHMYALSTFAERAVVPEQAAVKIRSDLDMHVAALIGCAVATGIGAVINTARVAPGNTVAIFGAGGVGLNVIQGAALVNAGRIIAVDIAPEKLDFARKLGATDTINSTKADPIQAVKEMTAGEGVDYAFDAVGSPGTLLQAFESTRKAGMTIMIGMPPVGTQVSVPGLALPFGEKVLTGSFYGSCVPKLDFPRIADLYATGKIRLDELVTRRFSIDQVADAFVELESGRSARCLIVYD
jgi:S-(hydroxymethyl)glutathione dehydrogenase/alcohol dehydrogenase